MQHSKLNAGMQDAHLFTDSGFELFAVHHSLVLFLHAQ